MSNKKIIVVAVACAALGISWTLISVFSNQKTPGLQTTTTVVAPTIPPPATTQQPPRRPSSHPGTAATKPATKAQVTAAARANARAAVKAAAATIRGMAQIQFSQDPNYVQSVLGALVTPGNPNAKAIYQPSVAQNLTLAFGWPSVADAGSKSAYSVTPAKYRTISVSKKRAIVEFFEIAHFTTGDNPIGCLRPDGTRYQCLLPDSQYWAPSFTVYVLKNMGNRWLCANYYPAPKTRQPRPESHLDYNTVLAKFQPFLRGFDTYEESA